MAQSMISVKEFLAPWTGQAEAYCQALGIEFEGVPEASPLYQSAARVLEHAYSPKAFEDALRDQLLVDINFLVDLAAPRYDASGADRKMISSAFWNTFAGRTIAKLADRLMGGQLLDLPRAAAALGINEKDLYHAVVRRRVSYWEDWRERMPGRRRRFLLDRLKEEYEAVAGETGEE